MKHAGDKALDELEDLLAELRGEAPLKERKRGVFYLKSSALLHFHEDAAGLFADLREGKTWGRHPVNTKTQQRALVSRVKSALENAKGAQPRKRRSGPS